MIDVAGREAGRKHGFLWDRVIAVGFWAWYLHRWVWFATYFLERHESLLPIVLNDGLALVFLLPLIWMALGRRWAFFATGVLWTIRLAISLVSGYKLALPWAAGGFGFHLGFGYWLFNVLIVGVICHCALRLSGRFGPPL